MKKILAILMASIMMLGCLAGCGEKKEFATDSEYVLDKGTLIVGITDFAPMDYKDENGNWIGFDADMATKFAEYIGVEVEFLELADWGKKIMELDDKQVDCVWNGMTLTDEVLKGMETAKPYCKNQQVVVVKKDVADKYTTKESLKDLNFAVESGSAGEDQAKANGWKYTAVQKQADALMEVKSGTSEACVIDLLMAGAMIGEGTSYPDLVQTVSLTEEDYGVGFRKGSDLAQKLNEFFKKCYDDGSLMKTAEKYGVQKTMVEW